MITRDNYEEFFLLYTDNELSAAEMHAVERFVAEHPDLREEWEALLQCRLAPDTQLSFPDRESLLRTEPLLYYIDGLPFLHPDNSIVFPDRDRLYRIAKERRIVVLPWLRAGIAAAVIGAITLGFLLINRQQSGQHAQTVADRTPTNTKVSPGVTSTTAPALHLVEAQPKTNERQPVRKPIQRQPDPHQDIAVNSNPEEGPAVTRSTIDPRKEMEQPASAAAVMDMPVTQNLTSNVHLAVQTGIPRDQSSFATQALQEEQAANGRENDFGTDEPAAPARTKLRGIFRKVTRAFSKTADRDNDGNRQVLVGAFQVTLN